MTPEQAVATARYVDVVLARLGLAHWDVLIEETEPQDSGAGDTVLGETEVEHFGYRAKMRFKASALADPDEARRVVIHECAHLFTEHWALDVDEVIRPIVAPPHAVALERAYERVIEAITAALTPHVPLPDWGDIMVS